MDRRRLDWPLSLVGRPQVACDPEGTRLPPPGTQIALSRIADWRRAHAAFESDHRLLVNVVRDPSGELLGQAGLDELAHLVDETRYDAVSRGILPDEPARLAARIEPVPEASDLPSLAGVRVSLWHDATAGTLFTREFPKGIAGSRGRELVSALIGAGILQEGDEYRVRLVAAPRAERPRGRFASPGQPETELDEIPFPVQRGSLSGWGVGPEVIAAADRHRPVFLARSILERATTEAIRHGKQETGMLVLGALIDDEGHCQHRDSRRPGRSS